VIVGSVVSAPLYGFLGCEWRAKRAWVSALLVGGAFCLEPLALAIVGRLPQRTGVWVVEVCLGVVVTGYLAGSRIVFRRSHGVQT
jgi:hypothetical protein